MDSLFCFVCTNTLVSPITLSCGYTICRDCLPPVANTSFICPVPNCQDEKHLFGPTLCEDQLVRTLMTESKVPNCPMGNHSFQSPITNHCGHTFCRMCLLERRVTHDTCPTCEMRLPSFDYLQHQSLTQLTNRLVPVSARESVLTYTHPSVLLLDFPILPSQRMCLSDRALVANKLFSDDESIYLAVLCRQSQVGTLVKLTDPHRLEVVGIMRFIVKSSQGSQHEVQWIDETEEETRLATHVYDFLDRLHRSAPSISFCNTMQGLLGPVWLKSVERMHGPLPKRHNALVWWMAVALPLANKERLDILNTKSLEDRFELILQWIRELESQCGSADRETSISVQC